ncbi:MAG: carbon-nitrogen hydrolase family protein [Woeseiaceae bacterium]
MSKFAAIQMASGPNIHANLSEVGEQISKAASLGAKLIVLPETFAMMGDDDAEQLKIAEAEGSGPIQKFLSEQASKHQIWLVAGTIPLKLDKNDSNYESKVYASCLVYNDQGEQVSRYNKVHLFDVNIEMTGESYKESETLEAGNKAVVVDTPFGRVGLAICYDLRFPELFRQLVLQGAEIIVLPAAFTAVTGKAHWDILLRARAIENLCYVVASAQGGYHVNGRETYGDSMIVDPWGTVLDRFPQGSGYVLADIDLGKLKDIRRSFPVLQNRKISCTLPKE